MDSEAVEESSARNENKIVEETEGEFITQGGAGGSYAESEQTETSPAKPKADLDLMEDSDSIQLVSDLHNAAFAASKEM